VKRLWFLLRALFCREAYDRNRIHRILVIRMNRIGDMIYTLPVIRTLKQEFPHAAITVLAEPANAGIASMETAVDEVLIYRRARNRYVGMMSLFGSRTYDLAISVKGGFSSFFALTAALSGARYRIGYRSSEGHILDRLYNLPADPIDFSKIHQLDACLQLLSPLSIRKHERDFSISLPASLLAEAAAFLSDCGIERHDKVIVMNISSNRATSAWSPDRFVALGRILGQSTGCFCIICAMPAEEGQARQVSAEIGDRSFFYRTPSALSFAAVVSLSAALVSGDGGSGHLAAAVGTPVVALFGETSPMIWRPYGERNIVLCAGPDGVDTISAGQVADAILSAGFLSGKVRD
jgi:ADP-heptose:LPS heptosyltransferase